MIHNRKCLTGAEWLTFAVKNYNLITKNGGFSAYEEE